MKVVTFDIVTASGSYTGTANGSAGSPYLLYAVEWVDGSLEDGVDAVLSVTSTPSGVDVTLLTLTDANNDAWYYPRANAHTTAGAAIVDGQDLTGERVPMVVDGRLKLAVTNGGDDKVGKCRVYLKCL